MLYSILSDSGVKVSKITIGTALFGIAPDEVEAAALIDLALRHGINFIDTANSYGNQLRFDRDEGTSWRDRRSAEEIVGEVIASRREQVVLATKVSEQVGEGPNDGGFEGGGLSRLHIMRQIEASLSRLQVDYIDIYYAHHPDPLTNIEETLRAFADLIRQGMIRYYALSTYDGWQVAEFIATADRLGLPRPVCHQTRYSLAKRWVEAEVLPANRHFGLSTTAFSPLAGGLLTGRDHEAGPRGDARWGGKGFVASELQLQARFADLADAWGLPAPQLALAWVLAQPGLSSVIVGPENAEQLERLIPAIDLKLTVDQLDELESVSPPPCDLWNQ